MNTKVLKNVTKKMKRLYVIVIAFILLIIGLVSCQEINQPQSEPILYVSTTGNDGNNGTITEPKLTIQNAIASATAPCEIYVAGGTYEITAQITMKEGVSLFGGYSSDFTSRDIVAHETIIIDTRTPNSGSVYVIYCSRISASVKIDGFTINASQAVDPGSSSGIYNISSSTLISNNIIKGGTGMIANAIFNESSNPTIIGNTISVGASRTASGIYNRSSSPEIRGNTISGGGSAAVGSLSYGIHNQSSSNSIIINNTIHGGINSYSHGIFNDSSSPTIINNTINGGSGATFAEGIRCYNSSRPRIANNIIFTEGTSPRRFGINEFDAGSDPVSVRNNTIFDCPYALYQDEGSVLITASNFETQDISTGEESQILSFWGNINEGSTAIFVDFAGNDLHLADTAPLNIRGGGVVIPTVSTDKDNVERTTAVPTGMTNNGAQGWSLGAYEKD